MTKPMQLVLGDYESEDDFVEVVRLALEFRQGLLPKDFDKFCRVKYGEETWQCALENADRAMQYSADLYKLLAS